jgi:hypothetical protein
MTTTQSRGHRRLCDAIDREEAEKRRGEDWTIARDYAVSRHRRLVQSTRVVTSIKCAECYASARVKFAPSGRHRANQEMV